MDEKVELGEMEKKTNGVEDDGSDTSSNSRSSPELQSSRGVWDSKLEFFLAIMGYTVGVGSVWRFPITCSRNGGGAFLIPFFFFLLTCGGPLYYMEICLGQFTGKSAGLAFEFCPLLKGIGILQVMLSLTVQWYSMVLMAWIFYFFYNSFLSTLPWSVCDNEWNTEKCAVTMGGQSDSSFNSSGLGLGVNNYSRLVGNNSGILVSNETQLTRISPAFEFWDDKVQRGDGGAKRERGISSSRHKVIGRSSSMEEMGQVQLHMLFGLFVGWIIMILTVIKGVKSLGKVVYVTATAPYLFLTVMLIRGVTLDGAVDGILVYITPDFNQLLSTQVWLEAAVQVFYSLGPAWGGVITMASYNKFHQKSFWSATMVTVSSGFTSFYNGLVVFSILGFMAKETGMTVHEVAKQSGPGLTFIVFPIALSKMPLSQLWAVLFFLTLITVFFDSEFGMFETITSGIIDLFPRQLNSRRSLVTVLTGLAFFIAEIPLTMNGGVYLFELSDWYFSQFALLVGSLMECLAISWIYGINRFSEDIALMAGRQVSVLLRCLWGIVIPFFTMIAFVLMLLKYSRPDFGHGYVYSDQAVYSGVFVGVLPILCFIGLGVITLLREKGPLKQRLRTSLRPSSKWGPNDQRLQRKYLIDSYTYPDQWWKRFLINIRGPDKTPYFY